MQLDPLVFGGEARRRFGRVLVWSGLALLAALALALAMVIASLALELGSPPAPPRPRRCSSAHPSTTPCPSSPAGPCLATERPGPDAQKGEDSMHNQHTGLSQTLAEQRITERLECATQARLAGGARPPRRRRRRAEAGVRRWWQMARRPGVATDQPVSRPHSSS